MDFCFARQLQATSSDPVNADGTKPLDASDPKIIRSVIGPTAISILWSAKTIMAIGWKHPDITHHRLRQSEEGRSLLYNLPGPPYCHETEKDGLLGIPETEKFTHDDEGKTACLSRPPSELLM